MPTKIPWTEKTWNPTIGCSKVSPGCTNCYAERFAWRLKNMSIDQTGGHPEYQSVVDKNGWTGKVELCYHRLDLPLHWRKSRMVFVDSMSDLFHEEVSGVFIEAVFDTIRQCPQHQFQILTKRIERAVNFSDMISQYANLWLGVTVENNRYLPRINELLKISAAVRFVSVEPMLGQVKLNHIKTNEKTLDCLRGKATYPDEPKTGYFGNCIHWVIIGAESIGSHAGRECKLEWVRDLVGQCKAVGVPVFVKQLHINGILSKNIAEWPEWARRREYPKLKANGVE